MATIHNPWTGEVVWLTDGRVPSTDQPGEGVQWDWIGLVAVSWPDTVRLAAVQVDLGELRQYRLFGYLGGGFTKEGQRVGPEEAAFGCEGAPPEGVDGWYQLPCDTDGQADNLSFQVVGGALIYELRFLTENGTSVQPATLGMVKKYHPARW